MTVEDIQKAMQDREILLADIKKRAEDYKTNKTSAIPAPASTAAQPVAKVAPFTF